MRPKYQKFLLFSLIAAIGTLLYKHDKDNKNALNNLKSRIVDLETTRNKLDSYQKLYVALLREYSNLNKGGYQSYIIDNLRKLGFSSITVYGCGPVGKLFVDVIGHESVKVSAFIDKDPRESDYNGIPVYSINDIERVAKTDCIIVTPVYIWGTILDELFALGRKEEIMPLTKIVRTI